MNAIDGSKYCDPFPPKRDRYLAAELCGCFPYYDYKISEEENLDKRLNSPPWINDGKGRAYFLPSAIHVGMYRPCFVYLGEMEEPFSPGKRCKLVRFVAVYPFDAFDEYRSKFPREVQPLIDGAVARFEKEYGPNGRLASSKSGCFLLVLILPLLFAASLILGLIP